MDEAQRAFVERRLKRRELWVTLWLQRAVLCLSCFAHAPLPGWARTLLHRGLDMVARHVLINIGLHVALRRESSGRASLSRRRIPYHFSRRALSGGRLRRAFKSKDVAQRLEQICHALETLDAVVARETRRLRRGLTRRLSADTRVAPLQCSAALNCAPPLAKGKVGSRAADTS